VVVKPRPAELVLVTPSRSPVGSLPAVPVATPWWHDVEPVVRAARDYHGVEVIVLRIRGATEKVRVNVFGIKPDSFVEVSDGVVVVLTRHHKASQAR